ncbi:MAG: histidinol phosphate phosphatase domain-containing protein [Thermodesulfobacteriota bacterium]
MIDLHSHCILSDGALIPAEHLRRVENMGYEAIAITDHGDSANLDHIIPRLIKAAEELNPFCSTLLLPGIELTHIPPALIGTLTDRARKLGALLVVVHGETIVEPVKKGTNRAALEAGVDILAHPGFITKEEASLAAEKGIFLEISGRKGHSLTNGHVAKVAENTGAKLAVNSDAHSPEDFLSREMARKIALGAGLSENHYKKIKKDMQNLVEKIRIQKSLNL